MATAEEVQDAGIVLPRALMWSVVPVRICSAVQQALAADKEMTSLAAVEVQPC